MTDWLPAGLGALVAALLAALGLWRRAVRQRDEARARAESAAASARRGETLRVDEAQARREHEAARVAVDARVREIEERREEARAEVDDARDDAELARILNGRIKDGRLP